ncbi:hypothetical protein Ancab_002339 [Ancistrocladus abbreviatus]
MANAAKSSTGVPPWETIEEIFDVKAPPSSSPIDGVVSSDVTIDPSRSLWFRQYVPTSAVATSDALPVVVYYHGGGFLVWSPDCKPYDDLCRILARELSVIVVSVNYRLAPEHRCPTQYDDGLEALKFIDRTKIDGFPEKADIGKCFLAGDSAGGNLAHHVAVQAAQLEFQGGAHMAHLKRGASASFSLKPLRFELFAAHHAKRASVLQTLLGFKNDHIGAGLRCRESLISLERMDFAWKQFLPIGSDRDHPAANVFGSKSNDVSLLKFPPTLVIAGGLDPFRDWHRQYYEWLIKSEKDAKMVEYPNAPHAFYAFSELPEY